MTLSVHVKDVLNNMLLLEQENKQIRHNTYIRSGFKVNYNSFKPYLAHFKLSTLKYVSQVTGQQNVYHF